MGRQLQQYFLCGYKRDCVKDCLGLSIEFRCHAMECNAALLGQLSNFPGQFSTLGLFHQYTTRR